MERHGAAPSAWLDPATPPPLAAAIDDLVRRATAKDPEQRFDDPGLVARAPARSSLGALFNYDLYYSDPADGAAAITESETETDSESDGG